MCGICGIVPSSPDCVPDEATLCAMCEALRHRGPDSRGLAVGPGYGLGFQRLAIIGLANGEQPIWNEDRTLALVCNGEIYNHIELRRELEQAGHRFRTDSDAEVILHLFEQHGTQSLSRLRGMFAFALLDAPRRRLVLARDRFGIKPLCWSDTGDAFLFASEAKAIFQHPAAARKIDAASLARLIQYGFVPGEATLFEGIRQVPPGHSLVYENGRLHLDRYWEPSFPHRSAYDVRTSPEDWAGAFRAKLDETVAVHLRSEVPVGTWLSGGVDSNAVLAAMRRHVSQPVRAFSLRFRSPDFDEFRADGIAPTPDACAWEPVWCEAGVLTGVPAAVWFAETPDMLGITLIRMLLARETVRHVKTVLTGEGSDEILGGYSWYRADKLLRMADILPAGALRAVGRNAVMRDRWPGAAAVLAEWPQSSDIRFAAWLQKRPGRTRGSLAPIDLFTDGWREVLAAPQPAVPVRLPDAFADWDPHCQLEYLDQTVRLPASIVQSLDRSTMAHSVEARVPFLDHELCELAARIPPRIKLRGLREKHVLRQAVKDTVPAAVLRSRKRPMSGPINEWFREPLPPFAAELLSDSGLRRAGFFEPARVQRLLRQQSEARGNNGELLMLVLSLQVWAALFLERSPEMLNHALSS